MLLATCIDKFIPCLKKVLAFLCTSGSIRRAKLKPNLWAAKGKAGVVSLGAFDIEIFL